jgi:hypothetical protein
MPALQSDNTVGAPTPPPVAPAPLPRPVRTLVHGSITLITMHALALPFSRLPLGRMIVNLASPNHFIPWSLGIACGLNNDKILTALGLAIITLYGYPDDLLTNMLPAIVGLFIGATIRALLLGNNHG